MQQCCNVFAIIKMSLRRTKHFLSPVISTDTSRMSGALEGMTEQL